MPHRRHLRRPLLVALAALAACTATVAWAGPLDPPAGPIVPTPGPEPRTAINAVNTPGGKSSLFRIDSPGSYYLTGNVSGVADKHSIEVTASDVTIDLAGFTLVGTPTSLAAIGVTEATTNLTVRNGSVSSWPNIAVQLGMANNAVVENLTVYNCDNAGIVTGINAVVRSCAVMYCGAEGIFTSGTSVVDDCSVRECGPGIRVGPGSTVTRCTCQSNFGPGMSVGDSSSVSACASSANTQAGILTSFGCTIDHCTTNFNGDNGIVTSHTCAVTACIAMSNVNHGVLINGGGLVRDCVCATNGAGPGDGAGILALSTDNRIESNACNSNDFGVMTAGPGNIIIHNTCSNNATNWLIPAGNKCLVVVAPDCPVINGNAGGAALTTDPNANFTY